jgi:formate dehydrogenase accessory protein FdhD
MTAPGAASLAKAQRIARDGAATETTELVAEEEPVALVYNGVSHAVMMATPLDLEDFGLGFSLSEGILGSKSELFDLAVVRQEAGAEIRMAITLDRFAQLRERRRSLIGRTGCGICGVESLADAVRKAAPVAANFSTDSAAVYRALGQLPQLQAVNKLTHSVHAAAWSNRAGELVLLREDVGRHNALDKLIGAMAWRGVDFTEGFAVITSRCSVEMVQKAASVGISMVVAISAPTALARRLAESCGMTMVALARPDSFMLLTHPHRLIQRRKQAAS